jgi:hypothetical protein
VVGTKPGGTAFTRSGVLLLLPGSLLCKLDTEAQCNTSYGQATCGGHKARRHCIHYQLLYAANPGLNMRPT